MEIDQNDRDPSNSIIELSKAFDGVHASKSDPNRRFPSHRHYTVCNRLKSGERTTRIDKKLLEIDQNDRDPPNSIIELSKAFDKGCPCIKISSNHPTSHGPWSAMKMQLEIDQ